LSVTALQSRLFYSNLEYFTVRGAHLSLYQLSMKTEINNLTFVFDSTDDRKLTVYLLLPWIMLE